MSFDDENVFITADKLPRDNNGAMVAEFVDIDVDNTENENKLELVENNSNLPDYAILNPDIPMETKVGVATNVANVLSSLIKKQGLVKKGLNKKDPKKEYVLVEGWEILGTMLGIVPITEIVDEMKNNNGRTIGYRAKATLLRNPVLNENGAIIGGDILSVAESCADKSGFQTENFSMMSMAQTRALGKAYRMTLSWVMAMAGYEPTPAEEMEDYK